MTKGLLIDLSGVVYSGKSLLPGAASAIKRLDAARTPYRFVTNTTSKPLAGVLGQLAALGLTAAADHVFTPARAAVNWLNARGHTPHLLVHPDLVVDFAGCKGQGAPAVVVGDAGRYFTYDRMNTACRALIAGAPLVALAQNRVFLDSDGELSIDAGAFVEALRYASGAEPVLIGKPAADFYAAAAESMGLTPGEVAMIGDDAEADVAGALEAGVGAAALVRTGKYRPGDETRFAPPPTVVVNGVADAVARLTGARINASGGVAE